MPLHELLHAGVGHEGGLCRDLARVTLARAALVQGFAGARGGFEPHLRTAPSAEANDSASAFTRLGILRCSSAAGSDSRNRPSP